MASFHNVHYVMGDQFKKKSDLHLLRKAWHMFGVLILFFIWSYFQFPRSFYILIACWVFFVPIDIIRTKNKKINIIFNKIFKPIMRSSEIDRLAGTTYLLSSVLFIALMFSHWIVSLSLLFLAFADPIASFVGIKWGRHKIFGHKSYEGFIAAFVVCSLLTFLFLQYFDIRINMVLISIVAGLCGALSELIPLGKMDDNFTMPILSSICLYFIFIVFNIQM